MIEVAANGLPVDIVRLPEHANVSPVHWPLGAASHPSGLYRRSHISDQTYRWVYREWRL